VASADVDDPPMIRQAFRPSAYVTVECLRVSHLVTT
jgi:hypothetical protein